MGFPFLKDFASISKWLVAFRSSARTTSPTHVVSWTRETSPEGVACFPSHHDRLRLQLDDVHCQLTYTSEIADSIAPILGASKSIPGRPGDLQAQYAQLSIALKSRWPPLLIISVDRLPTSHRVSSPDVAPLGPHSATLRGSLSRQV